MEDALYNRATSAPGLHQYLGKPLPLGSSGKGYAGTYTVEQSDSMLRDGLEVNNASSRRAEMNVTVDSNISQRGMVATVASRAVGGGQTMLQPEYKFK